MLLTPGLMLGLCLTTIDPSIVAAPRAATLLAETPRSGVTFELAQVDAPPPMPPSASPQVDGEALRARLAVLKGNEPSVAGSVVLLVAGALVTLASIVTSYLGLIVLALAGSGTLLVPGLIALVVGVGMLVGGGVWLGGSLKAKRRHAREVRELEQQLEGLDNPVAPPPMMLPPPAVMGPSPSLLLARF